MLLSTGRDIWNIPRSLSIFSVTDGLLYFTVRNRFNPVQETKDATSGIGLVNVKRRLNLLYGTEYDLWITTKNDWFLVSLQLNLQYVAVYSSRR